VIRAELWDPWGVSIPNTPIAAPPDYPGSHEAGAAWGPYGPYAGAPGGGYAVLGEVFPGTERVDAAAAYQLPDLCVQHGDRVHRASLGLRREWEQGVRLFRVRSPNWDEQYRDRSTVSKRT